jgi:DNA mismatch repair protein MLH1
MLRKQGSLNLALSGCYADGKLVPCKLGETEEPKPCAGNTGTQIVVKAH